MQLSKKEPSKSILEEAEELTNGDRQKSYGHPSENFQNIADSWNLYINSKYGKDVDLKSEDIALMMTLLKVMREVHQNKRDNLVDAAGYINTYQMCMDYKNQKKDLETSLDDVKKTYAKIKEDEEISLNENGHSHGYYPSKNVFLSGIGNFNSNGSHFNYLNTGGQGPAMNDPELGVQENDSHLGLNGP